MNVITFLLCVSLHWWFVFLFVLISPNDARVRISCLGVVYHLVQPVSQLPYFPSLGALQRDNCSWLWRRAGPVKTPSWQDVQKQPP